MSAYIDRAFLTRLTELKALPAGQLLVQDASQHRGQQQDRPADRRIAWRHQGVGHESYTTFGCRCCICSGKNRQCKCLYLTNISFLSAVKAEIHWLFVEYVALRNSAVLWPLGLLYLILHSRSSPPPRWPTVGSCPGAQCWQSSQSSVYSGSSHAHPDEAEEYSQELIRGKM